jgi:hypothetical protein
MSKRNRHGRHHGGPPPGVPKNPRFRKPPNLEQKFEFTEWYKPIHEAIQRGIHFTKPETDETTVVITTASLFEKMLELAIVLYSGTHPSETDIDLLFRYPGALSSFSAKINLCAMLGFLTPEMRHDLDIIRDVRNKFCHSLLKRDFTDHDIAQQCASLTYGKGINQDGSRLPDILQKFARHGPQPRIQFVFACFILLYMFMLMFVQRFRQAKALEPLKAEILERSKVLVSEKLQELLAQKVREEAEQAPQHHHQESTAPANSEEGQSELPEASPGSVPEAD